MMVTSGSRVQIVVDGVAHTGKEGTGTQKLRLKKVNNNLVVETVGGETQVELVNFYETKDAALVGDSWQISGLDQLTVQSQSVVSTANSASAAVSTAAAATTLPTSLVIAAGAVTVASAA